jgi:hypothetical protein
MGELRTGSLQGLRRRRLRSDARLSEEQVRAVWRAHALGGLSLKEIARRGFESWGYASAHSCEVSLLRLLERAGLPRRDRVLGSTYARWGGREER